jgi:hypothetical protein
MVRTERLELTTCSPGMSVRLISLGVCTVHKPEFVPKSFPGM